MESRLDKLGAEKGVTFDYADYYANAQADQSNLNQIGADLVGDGVDVIVAVATPTAATMLAAVRDTRYPPLSTLPLPTPLLQALTARRTSPAPPTH